MDAPEGWSLQDAGRSGTLAARGLWLPTFRRCSLSTSFLHLGSALANLELGITFADDVNSASSLNNLAVGVAVF